MTRTKEEKIDVLLAASAHLGATRRMLKYMGKPMSTIRKMDDAIDAINQVIKSLE